MKEIYNAPLIAAAVSWITAQIVKTVLYLAKYRHFNAERLLGAGGMPSAHSAAVCALSISISRVDGIQSTQFALSLVLALVVMYDATGVRRAAGLHAKEINRLRRVISEIDDEILERLELLELEEKVENNELDEAEITEDKINEIDEIHHLKEYLGHTPLEVLCGALLGILISMAF